MTFTAYLRGEELARLCIGRHVRLQHAHGDVWQGVQEEMASGLPLLGFAAEGVRCLVREGETGLLATPGDMAGFARALETLTDDEVRRHRSGEHARAFAMQRTWDRVAAHVGSRNGVAAGRIR